MRRMQIGGVASHLVLLGGWAVLEVVHLPGGRVYAPAQRALERLRVVRERAHEHFVEAGRQDTWLRRRQEWLIDNNHTVGKLLAERSRALRRHAEVHLNLWADAKSSAAGVSTFSKFVKPCLLGSMFQFSTMED